MCDEYGGITEEQKEEIAAWCERISTVSGVSLAEISENVEVLTRRFAACGGGMYDALDALTAFYVEEYGAHNCEPPYLTGSLRPDYRTLVQKRGAKVPQKRPTARSTIRCQRNRRRQERSDKSE